MQIGFGRSVGRSWNRMKITVCDAKRNSSKNDLLLYAKKKKRDMWTHWKWAKWQTISSLICCTFEVQYRKKNDNNLNPTINNVSEHFDVYIKRKRWTEFAIHKTIVFIIKSIGWSNLCEKKTISKQSFAWNSFWMGNFVFISYASISHKSYA